MTLFFKGAGGSPWVMSAASDRRGKAGLIMAAAPQSGVSLHARPCPSSLWNQTGQIVTTVVNNSPLILTMFTRNCCCISYWLSSLFATRLCLWSSRRHHWQTWTRLSQVRWPTQRGGQRSHQEALLSSCRLESYSRATFDRMSLVPWFNGRCLVWNCTCLDTLAPSHLDKALDCGY